MTAIIRLSAAAEADILSILAWSDNRFGALARQNYELLIATSLRDLASDPERAGSRPRPELGPSVRSYHLRHSRDRAKAQGGYVRTPRHFILYRAVVRELIGIGRVLHEAMELEGHLPADYGDENRGEAAQT